MGGGNKKSLQGTNNYFFQLSEIDTNDTYSSYYNILQILFSFFTHLLNFKWLCDSNMKNYSEIYLPVIRRLGYSICRSRKEETSQ